MSLTALLMPVLLAGCWAFEEPDLGQAAERLARDGPNALPGGQRRSLLSIAVETVREPMFLLLLAGVMQSLPK